MKSEEKIRNSQFANIIIVQAVFTMLILISVVVTKYFFEDTYSGLKLFYEQQICSQTDINEVIGETDEI